jgi:threonine dehydrogenase-like Zn-dependent dehydrogenase
MRIAAVVIGCPSGRRGRRRGPERSCCLGVRFNIACGTCRNCVANWTCACLRANPSGRPTAGYGPYWGGQAECLRVPWADFNLLRLPPGAEHENDFTMLSDIFPTGYHGTEFAPGREARWRSSAPGRWA